MNRSNKRKFAVTLLGALAFGANAQAQDLNKNKITKTDSFSMIKDSKLGDKSSQTLGAVRGANSNKNLKKIENGLSILEKVLIGAGITLGAAEVANETVAGIMWATGKKSDSIFKGKYSFTNLIRSKVKKNDEQPDPGDKDPKEKPDQEKLKDKEANKQPEPDNKDPNQEKLKNQEIIKNVYKKESKDIESEKQKKLDAILAKFEALDENSFAQKKEMLTALCNGILDKKYKDGPKYNKEIADKIINFINDPDGEHEVEIVKGRISYDFKLNGNVHHIMDANNHIFITNGNGQLLSHIGE